MMSLPGVHPWVLAMRRLVNLQGLADLGDDVSAQPGYLTISQVHTRLRDAGFTDSTQTIRRLIDDGQFGAEGEDWYRTERGGYRMISIGAVDRLIGRRRRPADHAPEAATRPEPSPVVAAIVTSRLGVLVGKRTDGNPPWTFIAGEIEPGESPADAATREVKEETGLLVRTAEREIGRRVHPKTGRTMIYLSCTPLGKLDVFVGDEDELTEVKWASLAEAQELLPGIFDPVLDYLQRELRGQ
ncbi:NUDIX domain-containing protein [Plantactinospora solaniradicis]|uniref:NUDIX domain-containing protein n=1 Tax=Plantactinospora solaniradicis TaxID=1723736 RepID=A0ABW1K7L3_9ACTN